MQQESKDASAERGMSFAAPGTTLEMEIELGCLVLVLVWL